MVSNIYDNLLEKNKPTKILQNFLMKIAISYPPIINSIGQKAMVSQNEMYNIFLYRPIFWQ